MVHNSYMMRRRCGVTLLELILALALSIVVLMMISMAVGLYFRMLDVRRTNVEESQVARVALKRIADDLRSIVQNVPPDLTGLEAMLASQGSGAGSQGPGVGGQGSGAASQETGDRGQGTGGQTPEASSQGSAAGSSGAGATAQPTAASVGAIGATATGTSATGTSATSSGAATTSTIASQAGVVGLLGTSTELRIDISRLPRVDEYQGTLSRDGQLSVIDIPSDVKTVTYFILDEEASSAAKEIGVTSGAIKPSATGQGRGLMRSEMSRAVVAYAEANGEAQSLYDNARMMADEVVAVQFQYFDGTTWLTEWDSSLLGGLPKAVEIVLTILPTYAMTEEALATLAPDAPPPEQVYRQVVNLPSAPLVVSAEAESGTAASGTSATAAPGTGQGVMP